MQLYTYSFDRKFDRKGGLVASSAALYNRLSRQISLVFITSDLMNAKPLRPTALLVFLVSGSYFGVLVWQQRVAAAEFAGKGRWRHYLP